MSTTETLPPLEFDKKTIADVPGVKVDLLTVVGEFETELLGSLAGNHHNMSPEVQDKVAPGNSTSVINQNKPTEITQEQADAEIACHPGHARVKEIATQAKEEARDAATGEVDAEKASEIEERLLKEEGLIEDGDSVMTVFPRCNETGFIFIWAYVLKGFIKAAIGKLIEQGACKLSKWKCKSAVNSFVFVDTPRIYLVRPGFDPRVVNPQDNPEAYFTEPHDICKRAIQCETMQGKRTALAISELIPPGTRFQADIRVVYGSSTKSKDTILRAQDIKNALVWGRDEGIGQWRGSGGRGRFQHMIISEETKVAKKSKKDAAEDED